MPLALTVKSVCGSDAAQSCDGWAAVWMTSSIWSRWRSNSRRTPSASRMSRSSWWNVAVLVEQPLRGPAGRGLRAEEPGPHVVLDADDVEAGLDEMRHRFRADQPACSCDDRDRHPFERLSNGRISRAPPYVASRGRRSIAACLAARCARSRCGRQLVHRLQAGAVGEVDAQVAGAVGLRVGRISTRRPVSSRQSSVVSASERLDVAPAADVDGRARPPSSRRRAARRSARSDRRRAAGRGPACPAAVADVARAGSRSGARAASR